MTYGVFCCEGLDRGFAPEGWERFVKVSVCRRWSDVRIAREDACQFRVGGDDKVRTPILLATVALPMTCHPEERGDEGSAVVSKPSDRSVLSSSTFADNTAL